MDNLEKSPSQGHSYYFHIHMCIHAIHKMSNLNQNYAKNKTDILVTSHKKSATVRIFHTFNLFRWKMLSNGIKNNKTPWALFIEPQHFLKLF